MRPILWAAGVIAASFWSSYAVAADCDQTKAGFDLTAAEAQAVYDCLKDSLAAGYKTGDKRWIPSEFVNDYRDWTLASAHPAAPGFHSGRFLVTWVNDVGASEYLEYKTENVSIPAGTILVKESFSVDDAGKTKPGPLFIMQKVGEGVSPETLDWYYMMVSAAGAPQGVNVMTACNECHMDNFGFQGGLGYPVEEARVAAK